MLYIDPAECIDCDACVEVCPVDATLAEDDVPAQWEIFKEINRVYFEDGPGAGEKMVADYLASKVSP
jgi:ferredoxin